MIGSLASAIMLALGPPAEAQVSVAEMPLGPTPSKANRVGRRVDSPDGTRVSWFVQRGEEVIQCTDGMESRAYDDHLVRSIVFSPDNRHVAAGVCREGQWLVTVDGRVGPGFDQVWDPVFSEDSAHVACVARQGGEHLVIIDDAVRARSDHPISRLALSPDAGEFAYVVTRDRDMDPPRETVVFRGESGPTFGWVGDLEVVTHAGETTVIYRAWANERWMVVGGDTPGPDFDYVARPVLAPDGSRLAYGVQEGDTCHVVADGVAGPAYAMIGDRGLCFNPDGSHFAYPARAGESWRLVMDGVEGPGYKYAEGVHFSPDGSRHAYHGEIAFDPRTTAAVIDGVEGPAYAHVGEIRFTDDSEHVYYWADTREGDEFLVIDGEPTTCMSPHPAVAFTDDGPRFAYRDHRDDKTRIVVDGEPGPAWPRRAARTRRGPRIHAGPRPGMRRAV